MARRKTRAGGSTAPLPTRQTSTLPAQVRLPLVVLLNFSFSFLLSSVAAVLSGHELGTVSRKDPDLLQAFAFLLWRAIELGSAWYLGYDGILPPRAHFHHLTFTNLPDCDIASLVLLTRFPYYFLLATFYNLSLPTALLYLGIDVFSVQLPFSCLRNRLPAHSSKSTPSEIRNASIIHDTTIYILNILLASSVYAVIIYASFSKWVPVYLIGHSKDIPNLDNAHAVMLPALFVIFTPLGWASHTFLFSPSTAAGPSLTDRKKEKLDAAAATLWDTVKRNVWGWNKGTKVLLERTFVLTVMVGLTTWIRVWGTVEGAEPLGAAGWAGVWAASCALEGVVLGWVGEVGKDEM